MTINLLLLNEELKTEGIEFISVNTNGVVHDANGEEIQNQPVVAAVIAAHDPDKQPLKDIAEIEQEKYTGQSWDSVSAENQLKLIALKLNLIDDSGNVK